MSNSNGSNYTTQSMNGIITFDVSSGTVILDGVITTNELDVALLKVDELDVNTIKAKDPATTCNIWDTNTGASS